MKNPLHPYLYLCPVLSIVVVCTHALKSSPICNSLIYCTGEILHIIQTSRILPDAKSFLNLKLLMSEEETLQRFDTFMTDTESRPNQAQLLAFLEKHFEDKEEVRYWRPLDYDPNPPLLAQIKDPSLLRFAKELISIWTKVGRKVEKDVLRNPKQYSTIYLPRGFVVPGGKTKELHYWDSYWIIRGLLISNMVNTAKGMIENFLYLVTKYGYVPSASRIYYLGRSHPPFLTWMVYDYFTVTGDKTWLKENIDTVETELQFWMQTKNVSIHVRGYDYTLLRYMSDSNSLGPRSEFYNEDYQNAQKLPERVREIFYMEIKSAAESGWDFSSRWLVTSETKKSEFNLTDVSTTQILPVDLNSIFAGALQKIGELRERIGYRASAKEWYSLAEKWRDAIENILWDSKDGVWYDFNNRAKSKIKRFYLSCAAPLWAGAVEPWQAPERARYFVRYLRTMGVLKYPGGVPTSLWHTGEQWDYPNVWPPLQAILIGALEKSDCSEAKRMAKKQVQLWVRANFLGFHKYDKMFDKYDCLKKGEHGGEAEYDVQYGYGWTNGYILELLQRYGDQLTLD